MRPSSSLALALFLAPAALLAQQPAPTTPAPAAPAAGHAHGAAGHAGAGHAAGAHDPSHHPAQPAAAAAAQPAAGAARAALPAGWQLRLDRATGNAAQVTFAAAGAGAWRVATGPSGILWTPTMRATGAYTAEATFTQAKPSAHAEAYGLFVGGRELQAPSQDYLYFVVRQSGEFLVKHRAGAETHTMVEWTAHPAIAKATATAGATNALRVTVAADSARFLVNGQQVAALPRSPMMNVDGVVGLRVNHNLDLRVADLRVVPAAKSPARPAGRSSR